MPYQSDRLWEMLGEEDNLNNLLWDNSIDYTSDICWNGKAPEPLFERLDLNEILAHEISLANDNNDDLIIEDDLDEMSVGEDLDESEEW